MYHLAYVFERFPTFTQTFCVREVLELERQGFRVLLFSIRDTRAERPRHFPDDLYQRVQFLPPEKELIDQMKTEKDADRLPQQVVLSLRHWGERPDKMRVYEAAWIGQRLRESGVRHVHSHFAGVGARVAWWLKHCYDFTYSFTGHANDIFCDEPGLPIDLARLMVDASFIVTVSDFTASSLRKRFPGAAGRIHRVYNGLALEHYNVPRRPSDPALIFSVGRLIEKKGFGDLISACAELKRQGRRFRCEIAGDGPLEEDLRRQVEELGVGDCVSLAGLMPQKAIIQRLSQSSVFALGCVTEGSGGSDNLPTVLMEAMAAAVPCVSTRVAGVPEMVVDGGTGRLVGERDPAALAAAIDDLLMNPSMAQRMGEAGRERARELFSQESTVRALARLLVARGLTRFDPALIARYPGMACRYARQAGWRAVRLARLKALQHRREPDFLTGSA